MLLNKAIELDNVQNKRKLFSNRIKLLFQVLHSNDKVAL